MTYDGTRVRGYANGKQVLQAARTAALPLNNQPLIVGARTRNVTGIIA